MGFFTFTDARVKARRYGRYGEYARKDKIEYSKYAKVVCPDNSVIEEDYYDGYGHFGTYDIYDLVVDWNKEDLPNIDRTGHVFYKQLAPIITYYIQSDYDDSKTTEYVIRLVKEGEIANYLVEDWKRNIGILLACEDEDNASLRYPIKITKSREKVDYETLFPSKGTQ